MSRLGELSFVDPQRGDFPHVVVPGSGRPLPLAVAPARTPASTPLEVTIAGAGRLWSLPEWNAATHGTALVVVVDGTVVHEWYAEGVGPGSLLLGASMTKSVLAHLVGRAVGRGALALDDRVVDHVSALRGTGWAACTVRQVMAMTSGVDWVEDHRDPRGPVSRLLACFGSGGGSSRSLLTTIGPRHRPGTTWEYCTADSQVLDWVREEATGTTYAAAVDDLGLFADDSVLGVDGDGVALAGGGLAATARDWARVALLQVDGTTDADGDTRRLTRDWVDTASVATQPFTRVGRLPSSITSHAGFGLHWWPLDDAGRRVTADGSRGQFAYAERDRDCPVAVVKTSQWPYDDWLVDRQLRDLCYLGLPAIAEAALWASSSWGRPDDDEEDSS